MRLLELFDTQSKVKWKTVGYDDESVIATFVVGKYRYESVFTRYGENQWEWVFEIDFGYRQAHKLDGFDPMGILNTGNAPQVFSTVLSTLDTFIKRHAPDTIIFTGDEDSRRKLYATMVRRLAGRLPEGYVVKQVGPEWQITRQGSMSESVNIVEGATSVVYHGTADHFGDIEDSSRGIFFTPNLGSAKAYAESGNGPGMIVAAILHLNNPLVASTAWLQSFEREFSDTIEPEKKKSGSSLSLQEAFEDSEVWARKIVFEYAIKNGHDSVIIENDLLPEDNINGDWGYFKSYVVFKKSCVEIVGKSQVGRAARN